MSVDLPLRGNLSVLENIALGRQYRDDLTYASAAREGLALLDMLGFAGIAAYRDPDLDGGQRFVAKLLRAYILTPPLILIDRPQVLLPDLPAIPFLADCLGRLAGAADCCRIVEYPWNKPLYAPPA